MPSDLHEIAREDPEAFREFAIEKADGRIRERLVEILNEVTDAS